MKRCLFSAAAADLPPLDFVLPGLLAGTAGLIVGPGAVGKTFLALQIGIGVALGDTICAGAGGASLFDAPAGGGVCIVLGEDPEIMVLHRLRSLILGLGLTQTARELLDESLEIQSAIDEDLALLRKSPASGKYIALPFAKKIEEMCKNRRLLILDPLLFFAGGLLENDNGDMGAFMRTLNQIAHKTGCAVLVLHHVGKASGDAEAWEKARGASALTTAVRLQMNLSPPSATECLEFGISDADRGYFVRVAQVKANYSAPREPVFLRKGQGGVLAAQKMVAVPVKKEAVPIEKKGNRYGNVVAF